jgi:hypothetical protein
VKGAVGEPPRRKCAGSWPTVSLDPPANIIGRTFGRARAAAVRTQHTYPRPLGGEGGPPPALSPAGACRVRGSRPCRTIPQAKRKSPVRAAEINRTSVYCVLCWLTHVQRERHAVAQGGRPRTPRARYRQRVGSGGCSGVVGATAAISLGAGFPAACLSRFTLAGTQCRRRMKPAACAWTPQLAISRAPNGGILGRGPARARRATFATGDKDFERLGGLLKTSLL